MRMLPLLLLLALLSHGQEETTAFFRPAELERIDEALDLLNMTRADLGFDKRVLEDDWRLPLIDRTLDHPLEAASAAQEWAVRARGTPIEILARAAEELLDRQGEPLPAEERNTLATWSWTALTDESAEDPVPMLALARREEIKGFINIARTLLSECSDPDKLAGEDVRVCGEGDDVHDLRKDPPRILIDRGGNDRYIAPARATLEHPVTIVIDLGGDDIYGNGEDRSCASAQFGVAILWDKGDGNDQYHCGDGSQGCGIFGVGILIDEGGSDIYRCKDVGQGAGAWGVGLLLDRGEGNDYFHADLFGQGFAYVGGFGLLHNESGQDVYDAGGEHLHYPLFNDRYQSLSQGFSIGMRPHASGGIGLLIDDKGNDRYLCDIYGQGASYWFAYGALVDSDGNDTYNLGQYGQGGGIHLAVGCLIDHKGQDSYYNMHGVGTGGAHDFAVGLLVDREGDDYYSGSGGTMGGALTNSFALLLDCAGNDGYSAVKARHVEGGGRAARGMGSIGLFLDLAGKDLHGTKALEATSWTKESYGAGMDLPDPPPATKPKPNRPHLSKEEVDKRIAEEGGDFDKLWDLAARWAVGEMADVVPVARTRLVELGDPTFERALERLDTKNSLEFLAIQDLLKRFGARSVEPLRVTLKDEEPRRRARAATLLADLGAKETIPEILPLLAGKKTKLSALDALARLGDVSVWPRVAALLMDETERVRVSAVRCIEKLNATDATLPLMLRLGRSEMFTVRFAAEDVLVAFKATRRLLMLAADRSDRIARRHAIRALGRIGDPSAIGQLMNLLGEKDWRIRYEAVAALRRFDSEVARAALRAAARNEADPHVRALLTAT